MKKYLLIKIASIIIVSILIIGCNCMEKQKLVANIISEEKYLCENGEFITATYYILSDNSLEFVKIILPDKKEYTLQLVVSASGVRYTDDFEYVWWTKGDNAFLEARDINGQWYIKYNNCKIVNKRK